MTSPVVAPGVGDPILASWGDSVSVDLSFFLNPPMFKGRQNVVQSLTSAVFTIVTFDTSVIDTVNGHSNTVNNSRYTCQPGYAGRYELKALVTFAVNSTGGREVVFFQNGVILSDSGVAGQAIPTLNMGVLTSTSAFMNVGDYIDVRVYQSSGGALSTVSLASMFSVRWICAA